MKTIIIGAGGHARVVASILQFDRNVEIVGFIDKTTKYKGETILGRPILGDYSFLPKLLEENINHAIVAVGDNKIRREHFQKLEKVGFQMVNAVHPSASLANDVEIGHGVVIAAGAMLCPHVRVGNNTIINTGAIVEHENIVGSNVHIAPGVNIAGRVKIGDNTFVGIGTTIKDYITIGRNVTIGAGSVVINDIPDNRVVAGVPAKTIREVSK